MKKALFLICVLFCFIIDVNANIDDFPDDYKSKLLLLKEQHPNWEFVPYTGLNNHVIVNGSGVNFRVEPNVNSAIISTLSSNAVLEFIADENSGNGCDDKWIKVKLNDNVGYVCATYAQLSLTNFNDIVNGQSSLGKSLVQGTSAFEGYRSIDPLAYNMQTNTWKSYDGTSWYAANSESIAYYLDPRNFLSEKSIFMFELLGFSDSQTPEMLNEFLKDSFMKNSFVVNDTEMTYGQAFYQIGQELNVSPLHLISRVIQEQGWGGSVAITGNEFTYEVLKSNNASLCTQSAKASNLCTEIKFSGFYNFFNIGANPNSVNNINSNWKNGLVYAKGGLNNSTTDERPWNNIYSALKGGAMFISNSYIKVGQNTLYFQKFNVVKPPYHTHQYMTNIMAPNSESSIIYNSYVKNNLLDLPFVFYIPVYKDMPVSTALPKNGNPNNYLKSIKINNNLLSFNPLNNEYTVYLSKISDKVLLEVEKMISSSTVSNIGEINIPTEIYKHEIIVTAANGLERKYVINFIKLDSVTALIEDIIFKNDYKLSTQIISNIKYGTTTEVFKEKFLIYDPSLNISILDANNNVKTSNILATGDKIKFNSNDEVKEFEVIIKGDVVGYGKISVLDLLRIQKIILKSVSLNDLYIKAADLNYDGNVTILDLLILQKHLLKVSEVGGA